MKKENLIFLIHGFMCVKEKLEPLQKYLEEQGYKTYNAIMTGHDPETFKDKDAILVNGINEAEFMHSEWDDWFSSVEKQFLEFKDRYNIILIGHSMGGTFSLALAGKYPENVHALITMGAPLSINTYYPVEITNPLRPLAHATHSFIKKAPVDIFKMGKKDKNRKVKYYYPPQLRSLFSNLAKVRKDIEKVQAPILVLQAFNDGKVPEKSALEITKRVSSTYSNLKMYKINNTKGTVSRHYLMNHKEVKDRIYRDIINFLDDVK